MRQTTICRQFVYFLSTFCQLFVLFLSWFCLVFVQDLSQQRQKKIVICQDFPEKVLDLSDFCLEKFEKQQRQNLYKFFKTKIRQIQNFFRKILTNDNFFVFVVTNLGQKQDKTKTKTGQKVDKK